MIDKISIIIPTYNRVNLLKRAIDSVLNQTYKNFELIIIDDGSTDDTKKMVGGFRSDSRLIYRYQDNSGGNSSPKNLGLKICTGEYITFLDSDDEYLPEKLEKQLKLFNKSEVLNLGFIGCFNFRIKGKNIIEDKIGHKGDIYHKLLDNYFINTPGLIMIKREILDKVGIFDENLKFGNDTDFFIRIARAGFGFDFVDEFLFKYYEHENSLTRTFGEEKKDKELIYIYEKFLSDLTYKNYLLLGATSLKIGNNYKAKKYFLKAFLLNKSNFKSIILLIISYLGIFGVWIYKILFNLKNKIV